ncbi:MAG: hypothetical protein A2W80_14980 [Candidatus Riflebacteria bacterium GWC2_50_8]|nr:MAG: hypothetical protein A2W80_14980 [Candidatus Riflebacteria bacterium GWC2_50_8]
MTRRLCCRSNGVTLIEILLSLAILTLVTAAISSGTNYLTRRLVRAKNSAVARNLAWKRLAEVKSMKIEPGRESGVFGHEFPGYGYSEEIIQAKVQNRPVSGLYKYSLTVTWPEAWQEDSVSFSTFIADYIYADPDNKELKVADDE